MKKIIYAFATGALCLLFTGRSTAQFSYNFTHRVEEYKQLTTGDTILKNGFTDTLAIGFNLTIGGITNDTLYVNKQGAVSTAGFGLTDPVFYPFGAETSGGTYIRKTDTLIDNTKVLILEFRNVKFDHDFIGADYANFQVWLYEADYIIESRYGVSSIVNTDWSYYFAKGGPAVGFTRYWLSGPANAPHTDTSSSVVYLTGTPDSGRVYRYFTQPNSIGSQHKEQHIRIYPNPSAGSFYIDAGDKLKDIESVTITDMQGRSVFHASGPLSNGLINTELSSGIYTINILSREMSTALRLIVH